MRSLSKFAFSSTFSSRAQRWDLCHVCFSRLLFPAHNQNRSLGRDAKACLSHHFNHFVISSAAVRSLSRLLFTLTIPNTQPESLLKSRWQSLFSPTILTTLSSNALYHLERSGEIYSRLGHRSHQISPGVEMTKRMNPNATFVIFNHFVISSAAVRSLVRYAIAHTRFLLASKWQSV